MGISGPGLDLVSGRIEKGRASGILGCHTKARLSVQPDKPTGADAAADLTDLPAGIWSQILQARQVGRLTIAEPWQAAFAPLITDTLPAAICLGQLGQSLDGRIATASGHSHYINGPAALRHLHCLRAVMDAVVVGIGTVNADNPQLDVRRVTGPNPARVVVDPRGRLAPDARLLRNDGARRIVVTNRPSADWPRDLEVIRISPDALGNIAPRAIVAALHACGLRRLLIEGGAATLSGFLAAGCLDRLHLLIAPLIIGSGPVGLNLPAIETLDQALRPAMQTFRLGDDLLLDIALRGRPRDPDVPPAGGILPG